MGVLVSSNALGRRRPSLPEASETCAFHSLNYSEALAAMARMRTNHGCEVKQFLFLTHLTSDAHNLDCLGNSDPCRLSGTQFFQRLLCKAEGGPTPEHIFGF